MNAETKKDVTTRLRSIEGHLKAVARMVDEEQYCVDVMRQTLAIEKALERVDALILESHLETCVAEQFRDGQSARTIRELSEIFNTSRR
jgi:DNA-binding FrmR family transcriptional regulator